MFVDQRGMLNPVSGKLISSLQTALTGEWSTENWQGNSGFTVATSGDFFTAFQGSTMVCNWYLGDVTLSGDTITLPLPCVKSFLIVASDAGIHPIVATVEDNTVILPDGPFNGLMLYGTLILKQA